MGSFFGGLVLGVLVAGVAGWYFYVAKLTDKLKSALTNESEATSKTGKLLGAIEHFHSVAWAPYGLRPEMVVEAANNLWKLAGLAERGIPPGGGEPPS